MQSSDYKTTELSEQPARRPAVSSTGRMQRPVSVVLGLATCCELIYVLYFLRQFPLLDYYRFPIYLSAVTHHSYVGFTGYLAESTVLFGVFFAAGWYLRKHAFRGALVLVLGCGAIFGLTLSFVHPLSSMDIYLYVARSWILVHYHQNPVFVPPSHFPHDPLMGLTGNFRDLTVPYGPIGILGNAIPTAFTGGNLLANLLALKVMYTGIALFDAYLVFRVLRSVAPEWALSGALLVAWNPLILLEISVNGHNDALMVCFALLALLAAVHDRLVLAPALLVASALVKYGTVPLIPLVLVFGLARLPSWPKRLLYLILAGSAMFGVAALSLAPFWRGPGTFRRSLQENQIHANSFSSVVHDVAANLISVDGAATMGRILFVVAFVLILYGVKGDPVRLLRLSFMSMLLFLALAASTHHPWYAVWPMMFAALVPAERERMSAILYAYGATLLVLFYGFVWVWLNRTMTVDASFRIVDVAAYAITFGPALLLLAPIIRRECSRDAAGKWERHGDDSAPAQPAPS